jgi:hypothetical protein
MHANVPVALGAGPEGVVPSVAKGDGSAGQASLFCCEQSHFAEIVSSRDQVRAPHWLGDGFCVPAVSLLVVVRPRAYSRHAVCSCVGAHVEFFLRTCLVVARVGVW